MADERELFPILENADESGAGIPAGIEGSAAPTTTAPVMGAKDELGNLQYLPLVGGKIPVETGAVSIGTQLRDSQVVTPVAKNTDTDVVTITLTPSAVYDMSDLVASSFQSCVWKLVHNNDGVEDELCRFVTGSGDLTHSSNLDVTFTAGATGTQELKIIGNQVKGKLSDMHASLVATERA